MKSSGRSPDAGRASASRAGWWNRFELVMADLEAEVDGYARRGLEISERHRQGARERSQILLEVHPAM